MLERSSFVQLFLSHVRGYLREPEAVFWTYGFPLVMIVALGLAFNTDGEVRIPFTVADGAAGHAAVRALEGDPRFDMEVRPRQEALDRLRRNQTAFVVALDSSGKIEYHFDPTNPDGRTARSAVDDALQRAAGRGDVLAVTDRETEAPGSRYVDFLVPGLIGMNLMGAGLWGIGFHTADLRGKNLLKRFVATPMRRSEFLLSLIFSRLVFFVPEMAVLLAAAHFIFGVPVAGSYGAILAVALVGSLTFAGLGLLTASRARRMESISGLMNLVMIPMWLCSGIFFSSERFPDLMQPFIQALPLTQLINALRAVILAGEPLASQGVALGILGVWCAATYLLALRMFRWI